MKKTLLFAAVLGALSLPALAQQSPTGQSSGGPARVGTPGQVGGGVPGTMPGVGAPDREAMARKRMMRPKMTRGKMMKRKSMRRKAMRRRM